MLASAHAKPFCLSVFFRISNIECRYYISNFACHSVFVWTVFSKTLLVRTQVFFRRIKKYLFLKTFEYAWTWPQSGRFLKSYLNYAHTNRFCVVQENIKPEVLKVKHI